MSFIFNCFNLQHSIISFIIITVFLLSFFPPVFFPHQTDAWPSWYRQKERSSPQQHHEEDSSSFVKSNNNEKVNMNKGYSKIMEKKTTTSMFCPFKGDQIKDYETRAKNNFYNNEWEQNEILLKVNNEFRNVYNKWKQWVIDNMGPLIIVRDDNYLWLFKNGKIIDEKRYNELSFHDHKAISHIPVGIYSLLKHYNMAKEFGSNIVWKDVERQLNQFQQSINGTYRIVSDSDQFSNEMKKEHYNLLRECTKFISHVKLNQKVSNDFLREFSRKTGKILDRQKGIIYYGTKSMIRGLHNTVMSWKENNVLTPNEWKSIKVVIPGPHMPRADSSYTQYFSRLLDEAGEGRRIIYAESLSDMNEILELVATNEVDSLIGEDFFGDSMRMHRDLLADSANRIINEEI